MLVLYLFVLTGSFGFLQPFMPLYLQAAGFESSKIGLLLGLGPGLALLLQPLFGRWSDAVDHRRPFVIGLAVIAALAYFAFPYVSGIGWFLFLAAVGSNSIMFLQSTGGVLVGRMVEAAQGGTAYAAYRVWGSVGYIVVGFMAGQLVGKPAPGQATRGLLDPIFTYGPFLFVIVGLLGFLLPDPRRTVTSEEPSAPPAISSNLKWFLAAYFLYNFALYGASSFLSIFAKQLGASGPWITTMFAGGVLVEVLIMRWAGRFSDKYGRRPALLLSFALLPVRLLLYAPATGPAWIAVVQTLHGINFGIVGAVAIVFANDLSDDHHRGRAQGRLAAVTGLATAIGPVVFGNLAQWTSLRVMFVCAAGVALAAALILFAKVWDSHPESASIADRGPASLRPFLRWLDHPPLAERRESRNDPA